MPFPLLAKEGSISPGAGREDGVGWYIRLTMTILFNKHRLKERRQKLRNSMPPAEVMMWRYLRQSRLQGFKFRRQYSIGGYVVDFYCPKCKLAIELDGPSHYVNDAVQTYDKQRQQFIEQSGIRVIRFTNKEVYRNIDGVITTIIDFIQHQYPPCSGPLINVHLPHE